MERFYVNDGAMIIKKRFEGGVSGCRVHSKMSYQAAAKVERNGLCCVSAKAISSDWGLLRFSKGYFFGLGFAAFQQRPFFSDWGLLRFSKGHFFGLGFAAFQQATFFFDACCNYGSAGKKRGDL
jgi:hypothetical protein